MSYCRICHYASDLDLVWKHHFDPEAIQLYIELDQAKRNNPKFKEHKTNHGFFGKFTVKQRLNKARMKYGYLSKSRVFELCLKEGHNVKNSY